MVFARTPVSRSRNVHSALCMLASTAHIRDCMVEPSTNHWQFDCSECMHPSLSPNCRCLTASPLKPTIMNGPAGMGLVFRQILASARSIVLRFVKPPHDGNMAWISRRSFLLMFHSCSVLIRFVNVTYQLRMPPCIAIIILLLTRHLASNTDAFSAIDLLHTANRGPGIRLRN